MKGKFLIYYDFYWDDDIPCQAAISLSHDRTVIGRGKTFSEAREKLIEDIKTIPEDELGVEIC